MDDIIINIKLKNKIMRRIYTIWFFRSAYFKVLGFAALAFLASFYISFFSVMRNAVSSSYSPGAVFNYMFFSFITADIASKALVVFMIAAIFALGWDIVRRKTNARVQLARI